MIKKYGIVLRLVNESDAKFILELRTNEKLGRYLSQTSEDLTLQENWIRSYKKRENLGIEYYFIVEDENGKKFGTTRLYNPAENSFEVGSWIFSQNSPTGMAIKADIICREFGFETFKTKKCNFEVRKDNKSVIKYHKGYKPTMISEDELNLYFELTFEKFETYSQKLLNYL
jgi:RimJ/RimL family protein N-acetyltransferase